MDAIDALRFQWTVIVAAIVLFLGMGGFSGLIIWSVRTGMNSVRNELKVDIVAAKVELKEEIAEAKAELKEEIAELKAEFKEEIAEVKAELKEEIADLRTTVITNKFEILTNRRLLARFSLHRHGDDGLPLAPLADSLEPAEGSDV